jgi:hypothetical protein
MWNNLENIISWEISVVLYIAVEVPLPHLTPNSVWAGYLKTNPNK